MLEVLRTYPLRQPGERVHLEQRVPGEPMRQMSRLERIDGAEPAHRLFGKNVERASTGHGV
jgi:hypothetical protein